MESLVLTFESVDKISSSVTIQMELLSHSAIRFSASHKMKFGIFNFGKVGHHFITATSPQ